MDNSEYRGKCPNCGYEGEFQPVNSSPAGNQNSNVPADQPKGFGGRIRSFFTLERIITVSVVLCFLIALLVSTANNFKDNYIRDKVIPCIEKPVIYLYPEHQQKINVKLLTDLKLQTTYPEYNPQGWTVTAEPSGVLTDPASGRIYSYLFYDAAGNVSYDMSKGTVVKGSDTARFLERELSLRGLNEKEANDFITYWLPRMERNRYNLVHFSEGEYENACRLNISPAPDSAVRVYMVFKPLNRFVKVTPQTPAPYKRSGYSVVEWGGTELK